MLMALRFIPHSVSRILYPALVCLRSVPYPVFRIRIPYRRFEYPELRAALPRSPPHRSPPCLPAPRPALLRTGCCSDSRNVVCRGSTCTTTSAEHVAQRSFLRVRAALLVGAQNIVARALGVAAVAHALDFALVGAHGLDRVYLAAHGRAAAGGANETSCWMGAIQSKSKNHSG